MWTHVRTRDALEHRSSYAGRFCSCVQGSSTDPGISLVEDFAGIFSKMVADKQRANLAKLKKCGRRRLAKIKG